MAKLVPTILLAGTLVLTPAACTKKDAVPPATPAQLITQACAQGIQDKLAAPAGDAGVLALSFSSTQVHAGPTATMTGQVTYQHKLHRFTCTLIQRYASYQLEEITFN